MPLCTPSRCLTRAAAIAFALPLAAAQAAMLQVTTAADTVAADGLCSLREAISNVNNQSRINVATGECVAGTGGDTIRVPAGTYVLGAGLLFVSAGVTIVGAGATETVIDANNASRVFFIRSQTGPVAIRDLTVKRGTPVPAESGGGIIAQAPTELTLTRTIVTENSAAGPFGSAGGIAMTEGTTLNLVDSTVSGNHGPKGGGGMRIQQGATANISGSTISDNDALEATAAGGIQSDGILTIVNSTISGNRTMPDGFGEGLYIQGGTARLVNVTIAGNNNRAGSSGRQLANFGATTAHGVIVADPASGVNCAQNGPPIASSYSIDSGATCGFNGTGDLSNTNPLLVQLGQFGGPTSTHALSQGSPAVGAGDPSGCKDADGQPLATDQRGIARPQGGACDIGAFEQGPILLSGRFQGLHWRSPGGIESGWGINFAHQADTLFATWFTYDATGKPTWYAAVLQLIAPGVYSGELFTTTGPPFNSDPFDPAQVTETTVGTLVVAFSDVDNGVMSYTVGNISQTKPITRQLFAAPVPVCTWLGLADLALATNFQDLWWRFPAGSEAGWGVNFTHQGNIIFLTWFTYGADGKPTWLVAVAELTAPGVYSGAVLRVTGPPFNAVPFDTAAVAETPVGTITITFIDGNRATYDYTVDGIHQVKTIERQVFAGTGTVCE